MRNPIPVAIVLALLAVAGCAPTDADIAEGDDPMLALTVLHRSERYGTTYWTRASVDDADLFARALAYCEEHDDADHPNCEPVRQVDMLDRASRLPEDRPDTFRLTVPQATGRDTSRRP
jgi:hypothetical protein